jgi:Zn-dependent protease
MTAQATYYIIRALVALVAIPFHEAGHALAAWLLGDPTAKREGRLSLNPFAHFDLLGTLCMVFAGVGWAKPVSTDPRNFKNPKWGMALTALAGPVALKPVSARNRKSRGCSGSSGNSFQINWWSR